MFGTTGFAGRYLFYVPTGTNDPKVTYAASGSGATLQTAAQAQALLDSLISSTKLSQYRGMIAPRNAFNDPWFTKIDLHLEQQIPTFVGHSRISVYADVENLLNLVNHNWGETLRTTFSYTKQMATVTCAAVGTNSCDHYVYSAVSSPAQLASAPVNFNLGSSLYTIRIGARITF